MTDTTNGKQYVGQHRYDEEKLDPNYHGSGHIIKQIYNKRPETFKEEYVKTCYSQNELDEWEKYFIFTNNTLYPNGYNLDKGGGGGIPCKEVRQKLSEALTNDKRLSKPVFQYTLSGEFVREWPSMREAERNGFCVDCISLCCREKAKSHHGYIWRYKGVTYEKPIEYKKITRKGEHLSEEHKKKIGEANKGKRRSEEARQRISNAFKGRKHSDEYKKKMSETLRNDIKKSKPVLQFTKDGEFVREWPSTNECGRNGFHFACVAACCRGEKKSYKGFIWKYK